MQIICNNKKKRKRNYLETNEPYFMKSNSDCSVHIGGHTLFYTGFLLVKQLKLLGILLVLDVNLVWLTF